MRNIAFLVIMIVTVAVAVSCNVQKSADTDGSKNTVSEKQETGSVDKTTASPHIIERDNTDVLNKLNELETALNDRIDGITLNVDNKQVMTKLEEIKIEYDQQFSDMKTAIINSDQKRKEQLYQILGAIVAATIALCVILLMTYTYLKKFIAESLIINTYKASQMTSTPQAKEQEEAENEPQADTETRLNELDAQIKAADYLFDADASVKLDSSQKTELSDINKEIKSLRDAGAELEPKHNYLLALEKVNEKNYTDASIYLDTAKNTDEPFAPAFYLAGYMAYVSRKYDAAIDNFTKACELDAENGAYLISYGNACLKEKKFEEAATSLKKAVEIKPDDASAWNNLAHAYIMSDNMTDAVEAFQKATEVKPDFPEALHNLGLALGKLKRYEEAAEAFERAVIAKPDKHESYYNAACVNSLLGKREGALSNLKKAIELQPDYADKAKKDSDFESFKEDEEFLSITK